MKLTAIYIFFFLATLSFGQNSKIDLLVSKELNLKWVEQLRQIESKEEQLLLIREKIKADSIVSDNDIKETIKITKEDYTSYDTVVIRDIEDRITKCKVLFLLQFKKNGYWLNLNRFPNQSFGVDAFNVDNIDEIVFVDKDEAYRLYGSLSNCGVVLLKSNDKGLKKIIRKKQKKV